MPHRHIHTQLYNMADHHPIVTGILTPIVTVLLSLITQIEPWLRFSILAMGVITGGVTMIIQIRRLYKINREIKKMK
jgi:hypothetical protein